MRRAFAVFALVLAGAAVDAGPRVRAVRGTPANGPAGVPFACEVGPFDSIPCTDGGPVFDSITQEEAEAIVSAAARSLNVDTMTIAVVDRAGRTVAVFQKPNANHSERYLAVGVARTAAFFSHNMAPLSSRTVRFISGVHFPPGVTNTPSAALYGIENTNRGCDLNVTFNAGKCLPEAREFDNTGRCSASATGGGNGCGPGIVTGKRFPGDTDPAAVNAGGIPLYRILDTSRVSDGVIRDGQLLGAIGVVGLPGDPQLAEFAAVSGAFGALGSEVGPIAPVPSYPLPFPGNVFIDGIRLPFLGPDIRLEFNDDGLPIGVRRLPGTQPGTDAGTYLPGGNAGGCVPNEYLVGPHAGTLLTAAEVDSIVQRAIATARRTRAAIRLPMNSYARMVIAVGDVDGTVLALYRMPDATVFSADVAVAKARNVVWFSSSNELGLGGNTAVTNRTIGFGSQPFFPPGIDSSIFNPAPGPWYTSLYQRDLATPCTQGAQPWNRNQNGVVFFAGSTPLYRNNQLIGGLGVSGDGIEQDDYVTYHGAGEFLPPQAIWADRKSIDGIRLPMFKFPRQPEGVDE